MRILFATVLCAIAASASATSYNSLAPFLSDNPGVTLINFDTVPGGGAAPNSGDIGNTYASLGVTFSSGNQFTSSFAGPVSPPNGWLNNTDIGGGTIQFDADFTASGIQAVGVFNVRFSGVPAGSLLQAFDSSSVLLGSVLSDNDGNTKDFFGLTTSSDIARITITVAAAQGFGLDDLYFGPAGAGPSNSVPDTASTLGLLAIGLLAVFVLQNRFAMQN